MGLRELEKPIELLQKMKRELARLEAASDIVTAGDAMFNFLTTVDYMVNCLGGTVDMEIVKDVAAHTSHDPWLLTEMEQGFRIERPFNTWSDAVAFVEETIEKWEKFLASHGMSTVEPI